MDQATSNFDPVLTVSDLDTLDRAEILAGYREFVSGDPEPGANRGRAYWHGWRNAARDHGQIPGDWAMAALIRDMIRCGRIRVTDATASSCRTLTILED